MLPLDYEYELMIERRGFVGVAGVDEVGRGSLAGNVYAAAVMLKVGTPLDGVHDSKKMTEKSREYWSLKIQDIAIGYAVGIATVEEIEQLNIAQASFLAMRRALSQLSNLCDYVVCDGFMIPNLLVPCDGIVRGDATVKSIAAASIIAKVARDSYMLTLAEEFPNYGFARHKGYGTQLHRDMLKKYGPTSKHRLSFLKKILC